MVPFSRVAPVQLLEKVLDELSYAFENNQVIWAVFLNVAKAFDTVGNTVLVTKKHNAGFRGTFLKILRSFPSDRRQLVALNR